MFVHFYYRAVLLSFSRLREYETVVDGPIRRGPDVPGIHYVILEMARESFSNFFLA